MNPDNGHLVDLLKMTDEEKERWLKMNDGKYILVPNELHTAAMMKLNGENETYVSMHSGGKLSRWAASQRKLRRKKKRMQKQSRSKNRK